MKKLFVYFAAALCFSSFTRSNEEKYLKTVFEAAKSSDLDSFKKVFITPEELAALVDKSTLPAEKKNQAKQNMTREQLDKKIALNFNSIAEKSKEKGLNWKKAKLDSVISRQRIKDGINEIVFTIYFSADSKQYRLSADKCFLTPSGRKLANELRLW